MDFTPRHIVIDVETAQSYDYIVEIAAVEVIGGTVSTRVFARRIKPRATQARRRAGLSSFPRRPLSGSASPG